MKDPLQTTQLPYEILDVGPGANTAKIRAAFMTALRRGVPHNKAQEAFNKLIQPKNLAKDNILLYQPKYLERTSPSPLDNIAVLEPVNRMTTAKVWEKPLKQQFPDTGMIHNLAVLWYWWTKHEEQRFENILDVAREKGVLASDKISKQQLLQSICKKDGVDCHPQNNHDCPNKDCQWRDDCYSSAPALIHMWEKVIGYWTTLAAIPKFWTSLDGLSKSEAKNLQKEFVDHLHNELLDRRQYYSNIFRAKNGTSAENNLKHLSLAESHIELLQSQGICTEDDILRGGTKKLATVLGIRPKKAEIILERARTLRQRQLALSEQYQALEMALTSNLQTAKDMSEVGVKTSNGKICCGPLMLRDMGLLNSIQTHLDLKHKVNPQCDKIQSLRDALSPYASIALLLKYNKAQQALEEIECLPEMHRNSSQASSFKVRALLLLGNQKESLGQFEEALENWQLALGIKIGGNLHKEIRNKIIDSCHSHAVKLQKHKQFDKAIAILKKAMKLTPVKKLELAFADILADRGITNLNNAYDKIKKERKRPSDALLITCKNALADIEQAAEMDSEWASKNVKTARELLEDIESLLPEKTQKLVDQANKDAKNKNWTQAIRYLEQAIDVAGTDIPNRLYEDLAWFYFNRGLDSINQGIDMLKEARSKYEREFDAMVDTISSNLNYQAEHSPFRQIQREVSFRSCAKCSKPEYSSYSGEQWYNYTLSKIGKVLLCQKCADEMQRILDKLSKAQKPDRETIEWLKDGEKDIAEATRINPSSDHIKKQLQEVHKIFTDLKIPVPKGKSSTSYSKKKKKTYISSSAQSYATYKTNSCPQCGFGYKWNGAKCGHCGFFSGNTKPKKSKVQTESSSVKNDQAPNRGYRLWISLIILIIFIYLFILLFTLIR